MSREREAKQQAVAEIKERLSKITIALLADYRGLKANQIAQLRRDLRQVDAGLKVYKNTLVKLALEGTEMESLKPHFRESIALITTEADPVAPAKVLLKFIKAFEKPQVKVGFMTGALLSASQVEALSALPSREEMLSKLLGSMQAPAQNLVNVMVAIPRQLVTVLAAIRDQKSS